MPTDTFSISVAANDGSGYYTHTAWPANGGTWAADDAASNYISKILSGATYYNDVAFLRFDTSALPDGATITGAVLKLDVIAKTDDENFGVGGDYYDFGGEPSVAADWIETASPSIWSAVDLTAVTVGAVLSITLTDLTGISKTGITGIRLTLTSGTPTANNTLEFAAEEHATRAAPQMEVTYTSGDGPAPPAGKGLPLLGVGR